MSTIIMYHASCFDGFCAAWLLSKIHPDAQFVPVQYGDDPPPVTSADDVIIADFSFDHYTMTNLAINAGTLLCFDHHKTMDFDVQMMPHVIFDIEKSGARLVWDFFHERLEPHFPHAQPWQLAYTEDRDLWKFELPHSRQVSAGLRLHEFDFEVWDHLDFNRVTEQGQTLWSYFELKRDHVAHHARRVLVDGPGGTMFSVPCVNVANPDLISMVGEKLATDPDDGGPANFGMTYFFDGSQFVFSVRSRGDFDVAEIAKHHGGGGHKNAAGFRRDTFFELDPFAPTQKDDAHVNN